VATVQFRLIYPNSMFIASLATITPSPSMEDKLSDETSYSPELASLVKPGFGGAWLKVNPATVARSSIASFGVRA